MTTAEEHTRGWALAPARLAREDVATLRRLYAQAHRLSPAGNIMHVGQQRALAVLHVDREDQRKLALAKLGVPAPCVFVRAVADGDNAISVTVYASVSGNVADAIAADATTQVAHHKFRRSTPVNEWTRILGRHCRHALGVLAHLRAPTLAQIFGASKVP